MLRHPEKWGALRENGLGHHELLLCLQSHELLLKKHILSVLLRLELVLLLLGESCQENLLLLQDLTLEELFVRLENLTLFILLSDRLSRGGRARHAVHVDVNL